MSKGLHISDDLSLPIDTVTSTLIVYGGKGMGKTNLGSVLVEELTRARLRWSVLDPLGVWWGLRHSADGKGSGIECLVLGGSHADIPIEPTAGAVIADLVVDEPANVIIDFSRKPSGEMWGIGEKVRFVTDYAYRLFQRQGELVGGHRREPIFQLLDEAARYIPQTIPHGAENLAKCVGAWEQLVEEGRNIGIGVGLLTQRSARMNKSVSEVADAILAFRIVGPNSIGAITDWLGEHVPKAEVNKMVETIRSLERGHCLVVSPGWLKFEGVVGIRARHTFDSSATPKPGERAKRVYGDGAKPDLQKYAARMQETIEKAKADDPKELRAQIVKLQRELKQRPTGAGEPKIVEVKIPTVPKAVFGWVSELTRLSEELSGACTLVNESLRKTTSEIATPMPTFTHKSYGYDVTIDRRTGTGTIKGPNVRDIETHVPPANGHGGDNTHLPVGERAVLIAAAQFNGVDKKQIITLTGYAKRSRDAYIQRLGVRGYVEVKGNIVSPTDAGIAALGDSYEPLPTGDDLWKHWSGRLPEGELKLLTTLMSAGQGNWLSKPDLMDATGYAKRSVDAYLQRLGAKRLVETGSGAAMASGELFD